ncbi:MAG: hypothetical protein PF572_06160 [Patescibacteria group bacterium]|jgi:hypothetical protein|nr:hypothetical protein [Patescibacteria group bacterium]
MGVRFYPTITAISGNEYKKLAEAKKLKLTEVCVFLSPLKPEQREKFYKELEKSNIEEIPFAHIRGDFTKDEIYYLKKRFKTKIFNFHSVNQNPILIDFKELKKEIYIENTMTEFTEDEINNYAGICIDISHLENDCLINSPRHIYFKKLITQMNCGCGHASAIKNTKEYCPVAENERHDKHIFSDLKDFDYLVKYKKILPPIIALEVENSLEEQLVAIEYINKLLKL